MADQITLIRLAEPAKPRQQRDANRIAQEPKIEVQIVERWQEVGGVQSGGDRVLEVVSFAGVRVGEGTDVADEGGFLDEVAEAGALGGVVASGGEDGRVAGFDCGDDAVTPGGGGKAGGYKGGELGVGEDGRGGEDFGFVGDVREDERGGKAGVVTCLGGERVSGCV